MSSVTAIKQQMLQTLIAALGSGEPPTVGKTGPGGAAVAPTLDPKALAGQILEGQIAQIRPDGQAVLQTRAGPIALLLPDVPRAAPSSAPSTPAPLALAVGQAVRLEIASALVDGQLSGRILPAAVRQTATPVAGMPAPGAPDPVGHQPQAQLLTAATAKAVAAPLSVPALLRQAGLAPLFANLTAIATSPVVQAQLPRQLVAAVQEVLKARLPLEQAGEPQRLREAVRQSGLFHEALATAGGPTPQPDLKSQLQGLKALLMQAMPSHSEGAAPELPLPDTRAGNPAMARTAGDLNRPQPAQALAPPRATGAIEAQGAMVPTLDPADASPAQVIRTLTSQVEGALDRQTLLQVASLPPTPMEARQEGGQIQRWFIELPVADRGLTQVLPLEIEEDRRGTSSDDPDQRVWRVKFALDDPTLGPVHGAVTLVDRRIAVTFWAEREVTRAALRAGREMLSGTLTATRFADAEIEVLAGAPPKPRAEMAGGFLDQRA